MFWALVALVALSIGLFSALLIWGGRIELALLIFGNPVFVTIDAGNPRVLLMLSLPIFLLWTAIRVRGGPAQK